MIDYRLDDLGWFEFERDDRPSSEDMDVTDLFRDL